MAKKQEEEAPAGSPAWMSTFSDLMNLLLCFFVLLFAMSSVDAQKFELVVASLQSTFSVLTGGTDTIGDGDLVGKGVSMMSEYDVYMNEMMNSNSASGSDYTSDSEQSGGSNSNQDGSGAQSEGTEGSAGSDDDTGASGDAEQELIAEYEQMSESETEEMAQAISDKAESLGIADIVDVSYTADYVMIKINGSLLFDSGSADIKEDAYTVLDKIGQILELYPENIIDIEGHTDNVPIHSEVYESNAVLSTFRALSVAQYIMDITDIDPYYIKYSGRGEYDPIADNSTAEGRAKNRRVEIKLYNSYNSN